MFDAWSAARVETGDHVITILDNNGGSGYTEPQMFYGINGAHVASSITITTNPGVAPVITSPRLVRIRQNGLALSIVGAADNDRISLIVNDDNPVVSIDNGVTDAAVTIQNVDFTKGATNDSVAVNASGTTMGPVELTNVSFFGGSSTNTEEVLIIGARGGGASTVTLDNVDFSGSDGEGARIRLDGQADVAVSDSVFSSVEVNPSNPRNAPALRYNDPNNVDPNGSNITFRDCSFTSGNARLFDEMGDSTQASPNIYRLYRPVFLGGCGPTIFNVDNSFAEVYVLGLDDSDLPTVPRVDLDPIGMGTTTNIAALRSGKISLQYVEASLGSRNLITPPSLPLVANPTFEMIGCDWQNGTGVFNATSTGGAGLAPQIDYRNTVFSAGIAGATYINANDGRSGVANFNMTHVTMTGPSFVLMDARAGDIFTASGCIFDGTQSSFGVAPTFSLNDGGVPNISIDQSSTSGWITVPASTIIADPNLAADGRLTAASTPALGAATGSTETMDVDYESRPQPLATTNDIGADEAGFPPTDITPNTLSVSDTATVGTLVGTLTVTDPDLGESFTWFLDDDASGRFVLNNVSGDTIDVETALALSAIDSPQTIDVRVRDSENNEHSETITITINDVTPPVITVTDPGTTTIECGDTWADPGAVALDNVDGSFAATIGGDTVDASPGNAGVVYTITYDAQDAAGNDAAQVSRTVTVVDSTPPVIAPVGSLAVTVNCGDGYSDPGATATDACDGPVALTTGGDTITASTPPGTYTITYDAQDTQGNVATQVVRTVTVDNNCPLTVSALGDTNVSKVIDEDHTFAVSISGAIGATTIQWFFDDGSKALDPIVGANSTSLSLTALAIEDSGSYVCQVSDDVTVAQSPVFTLTVSVGMTALGPMGIATLIGLLALAGVTRRSR